MGNLLKRRWKSLYDARRSGRAQLASSSSSWEDAIFLGRESGANAALSQQRDQLLAAIGADLDRAKATGVALTREALYTSYAPSRASDGGGGAGGEASVGRTPASGADSEGA